MPPLPGFAAFAPLLGERFEVTAADARTEMTLAEAAPLGGGDPAGWTGPFALVFQAPSPPRWPQGQYRFAHPALGEAEFCVVPVADDAGIASYEAIFN